MTAFRDAASRLLGLLANAGTGAFEAVNSGTAVAISDPSLFSTTVLTLNGAAPVITLPAPVVGKKKVLLLVQDATGTRIPTWATPSGAVKWAGGAAPTLSTAAARIDKITLECLDGTNWFGQGVINFS